MSLIKIIANNIELDVVKETLTIIKENNAFIDDFKVSYSDFPFLIVENSKTKKALGSRDITSVNKPKIVPVIVEELNEKYFGELQILSYLNGYRKVTIKYATELLTIMDKPIESFMPVVSVIPNENNPVDFSEESEINYPGTEYWRDYPVPYLEQYFPEVKWQFPSMFWKNKFGDDTSDKTWSQYQNYVNQYDAEGKLILNTIEYNNGYIIKNKNVVAPQIFLLSPLFYALQSIGFTADGVAYNDEFIKRILFFSEKNNLSRSKGFGLQLPNLTYYSQVGGFYESKYELLIEKAGTYVINYSFDEISFPNESNHEVTFKVFFLSIRGIYQYDTTQPSRNFSGSIEVPVEESQIGMYIYISYFTHYNFLPNYRISVNNDELVYWQMHPTIELGRYLPDWTFGTYLNELKKLLNLKIVIDDFTKKVTLSFNDDIFNSKKEIIKKSLAISEPTQPSFDSFLIKFENDSDAAVWVSKTGIEIFKKQISNYNQKITSKFKFIANNTETVNLSEEVVSKDGVGLMLYDPTRKPFVSDDYLGQTLKLEGQKGIVNTYWFKWLRFRMNSSPVEITGYFTEIELSKIQKFEKIYVDNQEYVVVSVEYSETEQKNFEVVMKLESISF